MKILVTELLDDLWALFGRASELAALYEAGAAGFLPELSDWMVSGETVLKKHKRAQTAELSALRAELRAASAGVFDTRSMRLPDKTSPRKIERAVAALLFGRVQVILGNLHETFAAKREDAGKYIRQMALLSLQKNIFYPAWNGGENRGDSVTRVWGSLMADTDAQAAGRHVLSLVSYPDALRILDEIVTDWAL